MNENCDGVKAFDRDHDGVLARPAGRDCRDDDARTHPGALDVPGNGIDDKDCTGTDAPLERLGLTINGAFRTYGAYTRVVGVVGVKPVPAGMTIVLRCHGKNLQLPHPALQGQSMRAPP